MRGALRIEMTQMEKGYVQRSPIVSQILDIYNKTVDGCEAMVYTDDVKTVDSLHYANGNNDAALIPLRDLPTKHFNVKDWLI